MLRSIFTLSMLSILIMGCNDVKVGVSGGVSMEPSAHADVSSCPVGMTLIAAAVGSASYCMDSSAGSLVIQATAVQNCASQGKNLCDVSEMAEACAQNAAPALSGINGYWTSQITWGSGAPSGITYNCPNSPGAFDLAATVPSIPKMPYYCCAR